MVAMLRFTSRVYRQRVLGVRSRGGVGAESGGSGALDLFQGGTVLATLRGGKWTVKRSPKRSPWPLERSA